MTLPVPQQQSKHVLAAYPTKETVLAVEFCHNVDGQNLLAFATVSYVTILKHDDLDASWQLKPLKSLEMEQRASCLAWSPDSFGNQMALAIGCANGTVLIWDGEKTISHTIPYSGNINGIAWSDEMENGNRILAVACEEDTFCLFTIRYSTVQGPKTLVGQTTDQLKLEGLELSYRGVLKTACKSVKFHKETASLLMVAERGGAVRLMDWRSKLWVWHFWEPSFSDGFRPDGLGEADWSFTDPLSFGAGIGSRFYTFGLHAMQGQIPPGTLASTSYPPHLHITQGDAHAEGCKSFRWSRHDRKLFATATSSTSSLGPLESDVFSVNPNASIKIHDVYGKVPKSIPLPVSSAQVYNISWHATEPILACTGGDAVLLFRVE